jgi:hypothetical protein
MKKLVLAVLAISFFAASTTWAQNSKRVKFPPGRTTVVLQGRTTGGPSESGGMNPVSYKLAARGRARR